MKDYCTNKNEVSKDGTFEYQIQDSIYKQYQTNTNTDHSASSYKISKSHLNQHIFTLCGT